jgi:hypothetical protein
MNVATSLLMLMPVIALLGFETWRMIVKKRKRFADRPDLSPEESQRQFNATDLSSVDFQMFIRQIAEATDIPQGKLRPTDRFDLELAPTKGWEFDDGLNLLPEVLQEKFGGDCEDFDLQCSPTVGEMLSVVARVRAATPIE